MTGVSITSAAHVIARNPLKPGMSGMPPGLRRRRICVGGVSDAATANGTANSHAIARISRVPGRIQSCVTINDAVAPAKTPVAATIAAMRDACT